MAEDAVTRCPMYGYESQTYMSRGKAQRLTRRKRQRMRLRCRYTLQMTSSSHGKEDGVVWRLVISLEWPGTYGAVFDETGAEAD